LIPGHEGGCDLLLIRGKLGREKAVGEKNKRKIEREGEAEKEKRNVGKGP